MAKYAHNGHMGIWAYVKKIWSSGVSPKKASKKMPCILHGTDKKIRYTISSQVSGRAQLPGVIIYIVDQESNTYKSGGVTWCILSQSKVHGGYKSYAIYDMVDTRAI